jgi:hypothetical protein
VLAAALVVGATGLFNVLVFVLFAVLWLCLAAALASARVELDEFWRAFRRRSVHVQGVAWPAAISGFPPMAAACSRGDIL